MDFKGKINLTNTNFQNPCPKEKDRDASFVDKYEQKAPNAKTPANPSYWQNLTFSGSKKLSNMEEKEINELVSEYSKTKYNFPKEFFRESLPYFVNEKTGRINKMALDFMAKNYFARFFSEDKILGKTNLRQYSPWYNVNLKGLLPNLVNSMKDKTGAFNKKNIAQIEKILKMQYASLFLESENFEIFNLLKDENGVIDLKKEEATEKLINTIYSLSSEDIKSYIKFLNAAGIENNESIINELQNLTGSKRNAITSAENYYNNCYDDSGNKIQDNIEFVEQLAEYYGHREKLSDKIYEFTDKKDAQEFLFDFAKINGSLCPGDVYAVSDLVKEYADENGSFSENLKSKFFANCDKDLKGYDYVRIFALLADGKGKNADIDEKKLRFACELYKSCGQISLSGISYDDLKECALGSSKIEGMTFATKVMIIEALNLMLSSSDADENNIKAANNIISRIETSICAKDFSLPVSDDHVKEFQTSFLKSAPKGSELTDCEKVLAGSISKLKEMKTGLPLSYSREAFLYKLSSVCNTKEKREILSQKAGIDLIEEGSTIKGYNGIILLNGFDRNNAFENSLYEICHEFLYENEIQTGDKELDIELNKLIKAMPEFINTIGKIQHGTQEYTLDIHQLLVLVNSINDPSYKKLNEDEKLVLKLSSVLHDISKKERVVDNGHQNSAAVYAQNIISKYLKDSEMIDRVYDFVKNHHWLVEYNTSNNKEEKARQIAFKFRRPNDFEAAKIFAKSDLMAVGDGFYESHKNALNDASIKPVEDALEKFYETGCALFTDYPSNDKKLDKCKENFNGREFSVINFHKIKDNEDLFEYGFEKGKTKKDLDFLVHMVPENAIERSLNIFKLLSYSSNEGALSESLINLSRTRTYGYRKYGLLLSQSNTNIVNISNSNQTTGTDKDMSNAVNLIFNPKTGARENFKNGILDALGIDYYNVSNSEFAKFYRENIANTDSLSKIKDEKVYSIGSSSFSGKELKAAIKKYQRQTVMPKGDDSHNEIVGYAPKIKAVIAKEKDLKDVPIELLNFAHENNLPIVLI